MIDLLFILFYIASGWIFFQLVFPFLTVAAARVFGRRSEAHLGAKIQDKFADASVETLDTDFACIITAYKNSEITKPLVASLLQQSHPNLMVYLVADECPETEFNISDPRFVLLKPENPLRLKIKSIQYAHSRFVRAHDFTVIFDADNLAHPDFLHQINQYIARGFQCVQGQRTAKNLDSKYAAADSLGELYKNYIERYAPYLLGGSSVISGSGMATKSGLYQQYLDSKEVQEGQHLGKKMLQEDKILQNFLLRRNVRIAFAWDAVCYDEKVSTGEDVQTQRGRWLFSYFQNIPNALGILLRGLVRFSPNQFFFGVVTLALPMFIQLAVAFMLAVAGLLIQPWVTLALVGAVGIFGMNVLWTLKLSEAPPSVWNAVYAIPKFILRQARGLFKMVNPEKHFKHSEHRHLVHVDEVIKKQ
jgi:cellulose synthase/poly-beta-1,6-N-acetylglucosamine synthase-like glycosyltransferase